MRCFRSIENSNPNPHQATEHLRSPFAMCCPPADAAGVGGRQHAVSGAGENFSPLPGRTILSPAGGYKLGNGSRGEASRETSLPLLVFERHSRRTETSWSLSSRTGNGRFGKVPRAHGNRAQPGAFPLAYAASHGILTTYLPAILG